MKKSIFLTTILFFVSSFTLASTNSNTSLKDYLDKKDLEKIILCDVQNKIYPNLEKAFLNLLHNSGYPEIKLDKKINFTELYKQKSN